MAVAGVVLDLDGTMVDSNYLHVAAWWEAFADQDVPVASADLHRLLGRPSADLVAELAAGAGDEVRDRIVAGHSEHYEPFLRRVRPTRGAGHLMRALVQRGFRLVVSTSAKSDQVDTLLAATGAADTVAEAVDSSDAEHGKPAPDPTELAMRRGGLDPTRTLMLGDSVWDVLSARAAGIGCVALTCGGIATADLVEAGAIAVYRDPRDLLEHLSDGPFAGLADTH